LSEPEQTPPPREQRDVPWWQVVDEHAAALESGNEADPPDPWADVEPDAPSLTSAQRAFLLGEDQPPVPRLTGGSARDDRDDADSDDGANGGAGGDAGDGHGDSSRETGKSPGDNREGSP
jgi:hypothetical protein